MTDFSEKLPGIQKGTFTLKGTWSRPDPPPPPSGRRIPLRYRLPRLDLDFSYGWRAWAHRWIGRVRREPPGLWEADRMRRDWHLMARRGATQDEWDLFHYRHRKITRYVAEHPKAVLR